MSKLIPVIRAKKVKTMEDRENALKVIGEVYLKEKSWIRSSSDQIPEDAGSRDDISWFLVRFNNKPAGVLRLLYDPVLEFPPELKVTLNENVDIEKLKKAGKFAEIGRFMIIPEYRKYITVVLRLMRAAIKEVIERDYTHFITDVFENEPNSPYNFHTRILGFEVVGKHLYGDLNCSCTRIILTLDILKNYRRLKEQKNKIFNKLTYGIKGLFEKKLSAKQGV
ncbi:MAG: GNAT family N-acetyltransferase [Brevinematales bacterium]|jgi:hypothetical protein